MNKIEISNTRFMQARCSLPSLTREIQFDLEKCKLKSIVTTRLRMADKPEPTKYESIPHAIGELLEEGWTSVTFQCNNVAILSDCAGDRLIIEVVR